MKAIVKKLRKVNIFNEISAVSVVLRLGMLFRKCKYMIEYEEDKASFYLANSVFNFSVLRLLEEALPNILWSIVSLIELDMRGRYQQIEEDKNTDSKGNKLLMEAKYIKIEY
jgi:hypothetical protein